MSIDHTTSVAGFAATTIDRPIAGRAVHGIFGLPFDAVDRKTVLARIRRAVETRTRLFITTPNTNNLIASAGDVPFRNSFIRSDIAVADGMPIVWIARLAGIPIRERVAGASLFEDMQRGIAGPLRVYIFGGPDGAAQAAHDRINAQRGPMTCVGWCSPGFVSIDEMSVMANIEAINRSAPDVVVAALSSQKGQAWVERNRPSLRAPVIMHLGAVVNFTAGTLTRAPDLVQRAGFEWLWRIKEEPMLWRRYWKDGRALFALLRRHLGPLVLNERRMRRARADAKAVVEAPDGAHDRAHDRVTRATLRGSWTGAAIAADRSLAALRDRATDIELDLSQAEGFDSAAIGWLMSLYGQQSNAGAGFRVVAVGPRARRSLEQQRAAYLVDEALTRPAARITEAVGTA